MMFLCIVNSPSKTFIFWLFWPLLIGSGVLHAATSALLCIVVIFPSSLF